MCAKSVLNDDYKGLVEAISIPAVITEKNGRKVAQFGSAIPIHTCTPEEVEKFAKTTHHYCDIFTEQVLAPLEELVYVRLDEHNAEKVFINRNKRLLLYSADGVLAQWRYAPTFESANQFIAGTPIVNKDGALISIVTAKRGNHYAVSTFEGEGGYFSTSEPWRVLVTPAGHNIYGDRDFLTREELRAHVAALPPAELGPAAPPAPVLHITNTPRIALVAHNGRQISHAYLQAVLADDIHYL